jgi:hypothetical protein
MTPIKRFFAGVARSPFLWNLLSPIAKVFQHMDDVRSGDAYAVQFRNELEQNSRTYSHIIKSMTVLHGPFKGLKYPSLDSHGSALFAKLLGSYEKEIHEVVEDICAHQYDAIINIGCGEGYYAVGLAMRIQSAAVFAFDTSEEARGYTQRMAALNNVSERVEVGGTCTPEMLSQLVAGKKALVVCDCEGCESSLFLKQNVGQFANSDLLIETHDFVNINISSSLIRDFSGTHTYTSVRSIDDIEKARTYNYEEAKDFDLNTRKLLFAEGRPAIMQWLYFQPKR